MLPNNVMATEFFMTWILCASTSPPFSFVCVDKFEHKTNPNPNATPTPTTNWTKTQGHYLKKLGLKRSTKWKYYSNVSMEIKEHLKYSK